VAEIEKQFTRLEAGVAALRRVQANLKRYRAAVLKAACEGRLVPTEAELEMNCANIVFARPLCQLSSYLNLYLQSKQGRESLLGMTTGSAQGVLNTTSVAELIVPLPPSHRTTTHRRRSGARRSERESTNWTQS
jgi:hypothetical protein